MPTGINLVPNNTGSTGEGSTLGTLTKRWEKMVRNYFKITIQ